mmetsp:Transcript_52548/g.83678  ORF Transcript_52548/g.83678 Transcript_52548/m.83678 type:complete len:211 (+) Transcript_52548:397-1029(+)
MFVVNSLSSDSLFNSRFLVDRSCFFTSFNSLEFFFKSCITSFSRWFLVEHNSSDCMVKSNLTVSNSCFIDCNSFCVDFSELLASSLNLFKFRNSELIVSYSIFDDDIFEVSNSSSLAVFSYFMLTSCNSFCFCLISAEIVLNVCFCGFSFNNSFSNSFNCLRCLFICNVLLSNSRFFVDRSFLISCSFCCTSSCCTCFSCSCLEMDWNCC